MSGNGDNEEQDYKYRDAIKLVYDKCFVELKRNVGGDNEHEEEKSKVKNEIEIKKSKFRNIISEMKTKTVGDHCPLYSKKEIVFEIFN
jgi:hypothetical protein